MSDTRLRELLQHEQDNAALRQQIATLTAERAAWQESVAAANEEGEQGHQERLALEHERDEASARLAALQAVVGKYLDQHCAQADAEGMSALCECAICREARALRTAPPAEDREKA